MQAWPTTDDERVIVKLGLEETLREEAETVELDFASTDSEALGCVMRKLSRYHELDTGRMKAERDSLTKALEILGVKE